MKKIGSVLVSCFRQTDKWLLFFWVGASVLAVVFQLGLIHAGMILNDSAREVKIMLLASGLGLAAAIVLSLIDYHFILKLWKLYLPLCLILVGLTFFSPFASLVGDNQAWLVFNFGGSSLSIQPSEFLKISFITTFSLHISKVRDHLNRLPTVLLLCVHGGAHVLLIQLQNDTGSALIFLGIFLAMLFCAGIRWRYIAVAAACVVAALPVLWMRIMSEDQKMRVLVLFNPELSERYTWQQSQALNAMVYGGMRGNGIFNDAHNFVYVPKAYNDMIFSFIGEACGFVGCLGVIVLLCAIVFKILYNARFARDDEGRFLCVGVFAMLTTQMIINLGMCLGLLPVIGVTLPLFSAGGSSVLSLYLGLGLVLSVYRNSRTTLFFE